MQIHVPRVLAVSLLAAACGSNAAPATKAASPKKSASKASMSSSSSSSPGSKGAGSQGMAGTAGSAMNGTSNSPTSSGAEPFPDPRGACDINSGFPGDEACILPPEPSEGMQIHIGPANYDDPNEIQKFIFHAGQESSECWNFHTPNDQDIDYQTFVLSGRPGTHHIIDTMYKVEVTDGGFTMCNDGGTGQSPNIIDNLPGASKAYMPRGTVAPENEHIARSVPAHAPSQADMHYFNYTDHDILREFWLNIYFVPKDQITDQGIQIRGMGGFGWSYNPIAPGTDKVYSYSCPINGDGRILSLLGHYHSHGKQFTASLQRASGEITKVFEMYDYNDPATFQYDSITTNPDFSPDAAGATSGDIEVHAGDKLLWDCHVVNDSMTALRYINNVKTGEMCNLWGESVGPKIDCLLQ